MVSLKREYASNNLDLSEFGSNLLNGFSVGFLENLTRTVGVTAKLGSYC